MSRALILLLACSLPTSALAQTTYTGGGAADDWNDVANWSAGIPGAATDVIFSGAVINDPPTWSSANAAARSITYSSASNLEFENANEYADVLQLGAGGITTLAGAGNFFHRKGLIQLTANQTWTHNDNSQFKTTADGNIDLNGFTLTIDNNGGQMEFQVRTQPNSTITGAGGIIVNSGELQFRGDGGTGAVDFSGGVTIRNGGTLKIENRSLTLTNSGVDIKSGGRLEVDNPFTVQSLTGEAGAVIDLNNNRRMNVDQDVDTTYAGNVTDGNRGVFNKQGTGVLTVSGTIDASVARVEEGTLRATGTVAPVVIDVRNGGIFEANHATDQTISSSTTGPGIFLKTGVGTTTLDGPALESQIQVDEGTLVVTGNQVGSGASDIGESRNSSVSNGGSGEFRRVNDSFNDFQLGDRLTTLGDESGLANVYVINTAFNGGNPTGIGGQIRFYNASGATINPGDTNADEQQIIADGGIANSAGYTVNAGGTLLFEATASADSVTVNGGTLGGNGNIMSDVAVGGGSTIAPGSSIGQLDISGGASTNGDLTFTGPATIELEILNPYGNMPGVDYDFLNVAGAVDFSDTDSLTVKLVSMSDSDTMGNIPGFDADMDFMFRFLQAPGTAEILDPSNLVIDDSMFSNMNDGEFTVTSDADGLVLNFSAQGNEIPEPTTIAIWSLLGLVGTGFAWRKRRKVTR